MLPITFYSSLTCEDSALARDRLRSLRIPFTEERREDDPIVDVILARWNRGTLVTPTVVFGDDEIVISEPTLEQLEETLREAGYKFEAPRAVEFHEERASRPAPNFTLNASDGREVQLSKLRAQAGDAVLRARFDLPRLPGLCAPAHSTPVRDGRGECAAVDRLARRPANRAALGA